MKRNRMLEKVSFFRGLIRSFSRWTGQHEQQQLSSLLTQHVPSWPLYTADGHTTPGHHGSPRHPHQSIQCTGQHATPAAATHPTAGGHCGPQWTHVPPSPNTTEELHLTAQGRSTQGQVSIKYTFFY